MASGYPFSAAKPPLAPKHTSELRKFITMPGIMLSQTGNAQFDVGSSSSSSGIQERRIIVTYKLPLRAHSKRDAEGGMKLYFMWDRNAPVQQMSDGFPPGAEVVYVGKLEAEVDPGEQLTMAQRLFDDFRCVPVFLDANLDDKFYNGFCAKYLWPVFHCMLPISPNSREYFDKENWSAYEAANSKFADVVLGLINSNEDSVWVYDYCLMLVPTFLRRVRRVKLGFCLQDVFPTFEIYSTLAVREEILRGFLNCDLVGFQTFDYARHFLLCCRRMLGIDHQSRGGYLELDYYGRCVRIKILPFGLNVGRIKSSMLLTAAVGKMKDLREKYVGKTVVLCMDDAEMFKCTTLKFRAFAQLLESAPDLRGSTVLVQMMSTNTGRDEIIRVAREINHKYGSPGYYPIHLVLGPLTLMDEIAYYTISECMMVSAVRYAMSVVLYTYTVCRQGSRELDNALGIENSDTPRKSMIIVSELIGCARSLSGAIRFNQWNMNGVAEALHLGISLSDLDKQQRHQKHYNYITSHDVSFWVRSFIRDLDRVCADHYSKRVCRSLQEGDGLNMRVVVLDPNFQKLSQEEVVSSYNLTSRRLIVIEYDGTMPQEEVVGSPKLEALAALDNLCDDKRNTVFIMSGRSKEELGHWFALCPTLGLSAEHGYFTKWPTYSEWDTCMLPVDICWKHIVLPIMQHYTDATDGSFIEHKHIALIWHHEAADPDFGSWQAKELIDQLETALALNPAIVKAGDKTVEVFDLGVSNGIMVQQILEAMKNVESEPDFVLCIGNDRYDEEMFKIIENSVSNGFLPESSARFVCTVGHKPSSANRYLDDEVEVIKLLESLGAASSIYDDLG